MQLIIGFFLIECKFELNYIVITKYEGFRSLDGNINYSKFTLFSLGGNFFFKQILKFFFLSCGFFK